MRYLLLLALVGLLVGCGKSEESERSSRGRSHFMDGWYAAHIWERCAEKWAGRIEQTAWRDFAKALPHHRIYRETFGYDVQAQGVDECDYWPPIVAGQAWQCNCTVKGAMR